MDEQAVDAIADLARAGKPQLIVDVDADRTWLVSPNDMRVEEVTDPHGLKPRPAYVKQGVTLHTEKALADYVNRFKTADTVMFADVASGKIRAVLDYHEETQPTGWTTSAPNTPVGVAERRAAAPLPSKANFVAHHAILQLRHSEAWLAWIANNDDANGLMDKADFVDFLEEHRREIASPDAATLLEMTRTLSGTKKVTFRGAERASNGNINFEFSRSSEASSGPDGKVPFASELQIGVPVYYGQVSSLVDAVLRWKVDDEGLSIGYHLQRVEDTRQAAFENVVDSLAALTGVPIYQGIL